MIDRLRTSSSRWLYAAAWLLACGPAGDPIERDAAPRDAEQLSTDAPFPAQPSIPTACPPETADQVHGTPGPDLLASVAPATCVVGGDGDDVLSVEAAHHRSTVLGGPGNDLLLVAAGVGFTVAALGDGDDHFESSGGAAAVWGQAGNDLLEAGPGPDVLDGDAGDDVLRGRGGDDLLLGHRGSDTLEGGPGSDIVEGGIGIDIIHGGDDDDLLYGDEGPDQIFGGDGDDLIEGGAGHDQLRGGLDADRLLGHTGDDLLEGDKGDDFLMPGPGVDAAFGGDGDDFFAVLHACQVGRGEVLDGGLGHDTLLTPLSLTELDAAGVDVRGFETIRQFPADGFDCDPQDCACGEIEHAPKLRRREMCDYSAPAYGLTAVERADAEAACNAILDELPALLDTLPEDATTADVESLLPQAWHKGLEPTRVAQFGGAQPHEPPFPPTDPLPNIDPSVEPCDMPQHDLHIGVAKGGINNCYGTEKAEIDEALDHARMMLFRMRQQIDAVHEAPTPAQAEALWTMGSTDDWGRFALSTWFGTYDADRVAAVRSTVAELEDIFYLDDDPLTGLRHNVQCYHRLKWWQYFAFGRINPLTVAFKTVANTCFYPETVGHAIFAVPAIGRVNAASVYYPFESIELCEEAFDNPYWDPPEVLGGIIMHELLHYHGNSMGPLKDRHGSADDGICDGPCYLEQYAEALSQEAPNTAVVNIDNYRTWANATHTLYTGGYCDDTDPGICRPSSCCGDGILQSHLSENCDGGDFGPHSCLTEAGLSEGGLTCSADCQDVTTESCFGSCGNDTIDPALGEDCDGTDFGGETCASLFGSEMGSLGCTASCGYETAACEGASPASYLECGVAEGSPCLQDPQACHEEAVAGTCTGGPCARTDPGARAAGQLDPNALFHPRGNFEDAEGHLYRCDDGPDGPRTCVDEDGFGVCRACGTADGQTMLGCPCTQSEDCGLDLACFGGQYPNGGYCWPADEGPPSFQCEQGGCGQEFWGTDGGAYCEHYPASGPARCMPQRCENIPAQACAEQDLICDLDGFSCANECLSNADCDVGWPAGTQCINDTCEAP